MNNVCKKEKAIERSFIYTHYPTHLGFYQATKIKKKRNKHFFFFLSVMTRMIREYIFISEDCKIQKIIKKHVIEKFDVHRAVQ
jgi:hypothetical protein